MEGLSMNRVLLIAVLAGGTGVLLSAQAPTPYKLGTFQRLNASFIGVVVGDSVIDFAAANAAVVAGKRVTAPTDMKDLIARYDTGIRERIGDLVRAVAAAGATRPGYLHALSAVKTMPPIMPTTMLNAAVNYREHGVEMTRVGASPQVQAPSTAPPPGTAPPGTRSMSGIWERRADDTRWNPYMFMKSPTAVIADGEAIRIPKGRLQVDWECELGVVVARTASQVPVAQAASYIFGYTMQMDVSDREARGDGRYGSDWLIAKNHDTFAPLGPFITPKEFVPDPRKLPVRFQLNGRLMQDADTSLMIHDVFELVVYGSNIMTLRAGDIVATGTPAGVGSARTPPVFLKAGDRTSCTYEGVGTLNNIVQ
jgi:2-keto-4-pentenoate hydratase/2-oxohepta-3-ene-1,7-dioic acid hydratase in catechol pathway